MEANNVHFALPNEPTGSGITVSIATGSGEALWEAGAQAGYLTMSNNEVGFVAAPSAPWYNDYNDFRSDLKVIAKGYSVVPEFRISERIEDYKRVDTIGGENFDTFEIPGTAQSGRSGFEGATRLALNSSQDDFYKD